MKRKVILETTRHGSKATTTAIISRNLSHNCGSHVLSRWIAALNDLLKGVDENSVYVKESDYSGQVYHLDWTAEDAAMNENQWTELKDKNPQCIVLHPIN